MAATTQYLGTGRRKSSVARVRLVPGTGVIKINKRDLEEYFGYETLKMIVRAPLVLTDTLGKFDVIVNVYGGGYTGQQAQSVTAFPVLFSTLIPQNIAQPSRRQVS